jgi:hypothetical protein
MVVRPAVRVASERDAGENPHLSAAGYVHICLRPQRVALAVGEES